MSPSLDLAHTQREGEGVWVRCSDGGASVRRPLVQLPRAAVAVGLVPLHSTHLLPEADVQHGHQRGQARGRPRANLPAGLTQLGLCRGFIGKAIHKAISPLN